MVICTGSKYVQHPRSLLFTYGARGGRCRGRTPRRHLLLLAGIYGGGDRTQSKEEEEEERAGSRSPAGRRHHGCWQSLSEPSDNSMPTTAVCRAHAGELKLNRLSPSRRQVQPQHIKAWPWPCGTQ